MGTTGWREKRWRWRRYRGKEIKRVKKQMNNVSACDRGKTGERESMEDGAIFSRVLAHSHSAQYRRSARQHDSLEVKHKNKCGEQACGVRDGSHPAG